MTHISEQTIAGAQKAFEHTKYALRWTSVLIRRGLSTAKRLPVIAQLLPIFGRIDAWIANKMPKGLYARALIIIIAPIVLLQTVVTFVFMERHWEMVTRRLSEATTRDIAMLISVYEADPRKKRRDWITTMAREKLGLSVQIMPPGDLPPARPKPFFALLDRTLANQISSTIRKPFWIDTVGRSNHVEIRIRLDDAVFRVIARRSQTYASNSHIFLVWMLVTSLILLTVAILFLRNQIKPILRLADAAETFGKGRQMPEDFQPRGAREVRRAAAAFMEMRDRIERHVEQRTTMLAGVSHDLRTILTRFKLQLALLGDSDDIKELLKDANEMQQMLEEYLSFAKGDGGEEAVEVDIADMMEELCSEFSHHGKSIELKLSAPQMHLWVRRQAFKRAVANLIGNAVRYADNIRITADLDEKWLKIEIDDDGPGIPPEMREDVFRPFFRGDISRNQDQATTGLGLSIALDIARSHGGNIELHDSPLGGLKAVLQIPV